MSATAVPVKAPARNLPELLPQLHQFWIGTEQIATFDFDSTFFVVANGDEVRQIALHPFRNQIFGRIKGYRVATL